MGRRAVAAGRRLQLAFGLLVVAAVALLAMFSLQPAGAPPSCGAAVPRAISHRGFDREHGDKGTSGASFQRLLGSGLRSYDLDLFWTADERSDLYVGHPPTLLSRWGLAPPMSAHYSSELLARIGVSEDGPSLPLSLTELLRIVRRAPEAVDLISLELKEPEHARWVAQLRRVVSSIRRSGLESKFSLIVSSTPQAILHRRVQDSAGVKIKLDQVIRDIDAPRDASGAPRANLSAARAEVAAVGVECNGWSISAKLLRKDLGAEGNGAPVDVWVVDDEALLRRAVVARVAGVVSNRPLWLRDRLRHFQEQACRDEQRRTRPAGLLLQQP